MNQNIYLTLNNYVGRLGNQLIQYAVIVSMSEKYGYKYKLPQIKINRRIIIPFKYTNLKKNERLPRVIRRVNFIHNFNNNALQEKGVLYIIRGFFQKHKYLSDNVKNHMRNVLMRMKPMNKINECVIHLRVGDFFLKNTRYGVSSFYPVLPINYYKKILKDEKLPIRFVAETLNESFIDEMKKVFPNAKYQSSDVLTDFMTLINAKKHILSVSTFSWTALWLSNITEETILPLYGIYHPSYFKNSEDVQELLILDHKNITYYDFNWDYEKTPWKGDDKDYKKAIGDYDVSTINKISIDDLIKKYKLTI